MVKVVYNACFGGFSLSKEAVQMGKSLSSEKFWIEVDEKYGFFDGPRHDPVLVQVVETLGPLANGSYADLRIEDIGDQTSYRVTEYDGNEDVETQVSIGWTHV